MLQRIRVRVRVGARVRVRSNYAGPLYGRPGVIVSWGEDRNGAPVPLVLVLGPRGPVTVPLYRWQFVTRGTRASAAARKQIGPRM